MADFKAALKALSSGDIELGTLMSNLTKLLEKNPSSAASIKAQLREAFVDDVIDATMYSQLKNLVEGQQEPTNTLDDDTTGFVRLDYPSNLCRPVPSLNLLMPDNWVVSEFPNALFVMGTSNGNDGSAVEKYWSNVIVRHDRVLPSLSLDQLAMSSWEDLQAEIPVVDLKEEFTVEYGDLVHFVREVEIAGGSRKENVTRLDSLTFGPVRDHPTLDLFSISWLHPTAAGDERKALYMQILESVQFA